jgi:hypothetical protein
MNYKELGYTGLNEYAGFVSEAYNTALHWPGVQPLYSRMRRSDPEISVVRMLFSSLAKSVSFRWETPDEPTAGDKLAQEFAESVLDDLGDGLVSFVDTLVSNAPFFGWGWWEVLPGFRNPDWRAPGGDDWRSHYDDNRIGIRRLAWRDSSSFSGWEFSDSGDLRGMYQWSSSRPKVFLPIENSLHVTFGDAHNPEGLSPLEAVWRLERIKYGLEVVQGIGFEHAAGYLNVTTDLTLTPEDQNHIKAAARAIMTAQEGNYAAWPKGVTGELKDISFAAAPAILEAIKYFGILKLTVFNAQWVALSSMSGVGSNAAMSDSSGMWLMTFNAMMEGFAQQMDAQVGTRLFEWNQFPGMTKRPVLRVDPINKVSLGQLASILPALSNVVPLGDEDYLAIRRQSGFLPEALPEIVTPAQPEPEAPVIEEADDIEEDADGSDSVQDDAASTAETVAQSLIRFRDWAATHDHAQYAALTRMA